MPKQALHGHGIRRIRLDGGSAEILVVTVQKKEKVLINQQENTTSTGPGLSPTRLRDRTNIRNEGSPCVGHCVRPLWSLGQGWKGQWDCGTSGS